MKMAIPAPIRDLGLLLFDPKRFARERTVRGRRVFGQMYRAIHLRTYRRRQWLVQTIPGGTAAFTIPQDKGFILWQPESFPLLAEAIREANAIFEATNLDALDRGMPAAPFTQVPFDLHPGMAIARLATSPILVKPFAQYLGMVPVLHALQLMYSPNDRVVSGSSQYFHLDGQDVTSLQVFVYLHDVTEEHGPLTLVPASTSERIASVLRYRKAAMSRRINDETIMRFIDPSRDLCVMTGPAGSVLAFDGDRCFHFGSRKGTRPRRILHYAYVSPFAFTLSPKWWERFRQLVETDAPEWQRSIVGRA